MIHQNHLYLCLVLLVFACTTGQNEQQVLPGLADVDITRIEVEHSGHHDILIRELDGEWYYAGMDRVRFDEVKTLLDDLAGLACDIEAPLSRQFQSNEIVVRLAGNFIAEPITVRFLLVEGIPDRTYIVNDAHRDSIYSCTGSNVYSSILANFESILQSANSMQER